MIKKTQINNQLLIPIKKKLKILYEDEFLMIVYKESNLLIHPTKFENRKTLSNYIKYYFIKENIFFDDNDIRWGICHRLDKETMGLIIVAKNLKVQNKIIKLFKNKKIEKKYFAIVKGKLKNKNIKVETFLNRKNNSTKYFVSNYSENNKEKAITIFHEIKYYNNFSLVECEILTGQTHQIRVHAKFINNPIINDSIYNSESKNLENEILFLCAYYLKFNHPIIKNKVINVKINLPKKFINYISENEK